ncbi:hypothetical protein VER_07930 [Veillonella sp. R32]|nr:hypothetical protein VER_07930 [Veillonella sp. R32]
MKHTGVLGTNITGQTVDLQAGRDVSMTAAQIGSLEGTTIEAGSNIRANSAEQYDYTMADVKVKKSGIMGSGMGFMIGTKKSTDEQQGEAITQVGTTIGSVNGNTQIKAGDTVHLTTTDVIGRSGVFVTGQDVILDGNQNTSTNQYMHKESSSGLTVSLGGQVATSITDGIRYKNQAKDRDNTILKSLEAYRAAKAFDEATNAFNAYRNTNSVITKDRLVNLRIGLGSSSSRSETTLHTESYVGGSLHSDGAVVVQAISPSVSQGTIRATGETIQGDIVRLQATKDIQLLAGTNQRNTTEVSSSSGWSVGANIGLQTGMPLAIDASVSKSKGTGQGEIVTHTGTNITGITGVQVNSGRDMIVEGSRIDGNRVLVTVGRDLMMTSLQDKDVYTNTEKHSGLQVSYNFDVLSGSPLHSKTTMNSSYQSVTKQAGIYAGEGGYNIAVGDTTRLTGAVIGSKADNSQNVITTKSLYTSDIENRAEYKAASSGGNGLVGVVSDTLGTMSVSGQSSSTTRSAIADGMIISGQGDSIDTIYRNTEEALQALKPIFDKQTVEEKLALTQILSEEGFKLVGDIATKQYIQNIQKAQEATSEAEAKGYREEANKWADGGIYKIGLHTLVGAGLGQFTGHGAITGAVSAGTNEALQPALSQIDNEELHKLASLVIGNVVTGSTFGGATALDATKFNWLNHYDQEYLLKDIMENEYDKYTLSQKIAFYIALNNLTAPYADELGINDGVSGYVYERYGTSLQYKLGAGFGNTIDTLAAALYNYAENQGIDRSYLDFLVAQNMKTYGDFNWLNHHYQGRLGNFKDVTNALASNAAITNWGYSGATSVANRGDVYADKGYKVFTAPDGHNYVSVNGELLYTTRESMYSSNDFGNALADLGYVVHKGNGWNYVLYNDKAYYVNRRANDGTVLGGDANYDNPSSVGIAVEVHGLGHVSLVAGFNNDTHFEEANFGRYIPNNTKKTQSVNIPYIRSITQANGIGAFLVDPNYILGREKTVYLLNDHYVDVKKVIDNYNTRVKSEGYVAQLDTFYLGEDRISPFAYRISGSIDNYQLFSNNCATTTLVAIRKAIKDDSIDINVKNINELLEGINPRVVRNILEEDYKTYHGKGIVKDMIVGKEEISNIADSLMNVSSSMNH